MKKSKTLRLHRQHDLDLITLYRANGFSFSKEVRNILVAYVNREPYEPPEIDYEDVDIGYLPTTIQYHLTLDPSDPREKAALDMLHDEIKYGYVNSFIKALVRAYIPRIPFIGYGVANGFVTRRITANDVGMKMREAQKVEAAIFKTEDLAPGAEDSNNVGLHEMNLTAVTNNQNRNEMKPTESEPTVIEPKQMETTPVVPAYLETQTEAIIQNQNIAVSEDPVDDDDEDDFGKFLQSAQKFTTA